MSTAAPARVGVFGGSFNPPHICHLLASQYLLETTDLEEVWWVPVHHHAFDKDRHLASWHHRVAMCEAVVASRPGLRVDTVEADLGERSWTVDTVAALRERNPGVEFSWIIGSDLLPELPLWSRWQELREHVRFVVLGRGAPASLAELPAGGSFLVRDFHLPDISSSAVRKLLAAGEDARHLVPVAVSAYLKATPGLYR